MPQWTSERNWSANVFQETYARMMKALKNAHQQNGLAALHASSMPGLRHNNNNDDKYREEIVGYFAFLCVWHRFVELVMRGKCKRYSKYNWRFSFHASNTSWILALKIQKWSVFHMTQLLRRKLKVKLKTKLHRKVQCRWYNLAGNRSIYSCVTQILFPYAVFAGLVLIFFWCSAWNAFKYEELQQSGSKEDEEITRSWGGQPRRFHSSLTCYYHWSWRTE